MIDFKYFLIEQPIGKLYLGALTAKDINKIAESNTRTAYNQKGIQRKIIDSRVKEIAKYSAHDDAIFPTPIVLSASSNYIKFEGDGLLRIDDDKIKNDEAFFSIIDGQHRLAGIKEADKLDVFTLPVVLILDTFLEQDAEIFVTINGNQRSVSKSLLYDLFGLSKNRSVEKVCHTIIKALNKDDNSKIKQKIKMLGYRDEVNGEKLKDLDENRFIFRKYFEQEQDDIIYKILKNYFNAWTTAKEKLNSNKDLVFLEKSIGYMASFYLLRAVFLKSKLEKSATEDYFQNNLSKILNKFNADYNSKTYSSSQSGARELFKDLVRSAIKSNTFDEKYIKAYRDDSDLKKWFDEYEDILFIEK